MTLEDKLRHVIGLKDQALARYRPCMDHYDKVNRNGEWRCQVCRAEAAEAKVKRLEARLAELEPTR